jgi:dihydroflavonol-4-reductase
MLPVFRPPWTWALIGPRERVSARQAELDLGWAMRPVRESIVDTGRSLIEHGVMPARAG